MNLYLTGFMAAGKTTVGRMLARRLGRRFVDLDAEIERSCGCSVADIFRRGEGAFRRAETWALRRITRDDGLVAALGAGALTRAENRRLISGSGLLVGLTCAEPELWRRLRSGPAGRPRRGPVPGRRNRLRALLRRRRAGYAHAAIQASTTRNTPGRTAAQLHRKLRPLL
ncbi:MAG: shikimate kinase [Elusimicrobiota bacterium]|jgi:shikimate kinase